MGKSQSKRKRESEKSEESAKNGSDVSTEVKPTKKKFFGFSAVKQKNDKTAKNIIRKNSVRSSKRKNKTGVQNGQVKKPVAEVRPMTEHDYEASVQQKLKKLIQGDCNKLLLNLMLFSVQFYANFERETYDTVDLNRKEENEKTKRIAEHCKTILLPEPIRDAVDRKVRFQARHGPLKHQLLSLDTKTMFMVFDNIDVSQPDGDLYSTLSNTTTYKFVMEDHNYQRGQCRTRISHKGYVKLRSIDVINDGKFKKDSLSSEPGTSKGLPLVYSDEDDGFEVNSQHSVPVSRAWSGLKPDRKSVCYVNGMPFNTSMSARTSQASSEYDYAFITAFNSHKAFSVQMTPSDEPLSTTQIPVNCICLERREDEIVLTESEGSDEDLDDLEIADDLEEEEEDEKESTIRNASIIGGDTRPYLNSLNFFQYFKSIFKAQIAVDLGLSQKDLDSATERAASVFVPPYEIVPAIHCPWPNEAYEWRVRKRNPIVIPYSSQKCVWPNPQMVSRVVSLGCHVIPVGYAPKKGKNPTQQVEWKIVFPAAERCLEMSLTNAQVKVYMIMKAVFKSFIEPRMENGTNVLTKEHLRTQLFWLVEENPAAWNEECLGESFLRYLKALSNSLQKHSLPNYFLRDLNLLDNVRERVISNLHLLLTRISENPVFYVMSALRNLHYTKNFYPPLPVKKLYSYLIVDNPLYLITPALFAQEEKRPEKKDSLATQKSEALGIIGDSYRMEAKPKTRSKTKTRGASKGATKKEPQETEDTRRASVQSIDVTDYRVPRNIDGPRLQLILHLFVRHFLEMASRTMENSAPNLSLTYLKQAQRLSLILHEYGETEEAASYMAKIEPMLKQAYTFGRYNSVTGPSLPRRTSDDQPGPSRSERNIRRESAESDDTIRNETPRDRPHQGRRTGVSQGMAQDPKVMQAASNFRVRAQVHGLNDYRSSAGRPFGRS